MKHKLILFAVSVLTAIPATVSAQLKVFSDGTSVIKRSSQNPYAYLSVTNSEYSSFSGYNIGLTCGTTVTSSYNIALMAGVLPSSPMSFGRSFGLVATAGNAYGGYNYGVYSRLLGSNNGAAIAGTLYDNLGINLTGRYAGYFDGPTYVAGSFTAASLLTPSDLRQQENVTLLRNETKTQFETLSNIMNMDVVRFNYADRRIEESDTGKVMTRPFETGEKHRHYGLSAEELLKVYPDLVYEGEDGYLTINYAELVPILIRSIQELKQELDEVRGADAAPARGNATAIRTATASNGNILYQNAPNPFKEKTTIRFSLAPDAQNVSICIFDMTGKMLKRLPVSQGDTSVSVNGYELDEGIFLYSLLVNGQELDTKRMIITQ